MVQCISSTPGKPESVMVTSNPESHRSSEYTLTWQTVSLLRVEEYRILYRPVPHTLDHDLPVSFTTDKISRQKNWRHKKRPGDWTTSIIQAAANNKLAIKR